MIVAVDVGGTFTDFVYVRRMDLSVSIRSFLPLVALRLLFLKVCVFSAVLALLFTLLLLLLTLLGVRLGWSFLGLLLSPLEGLGM